MNTSSNIGSIEFESLDDWLENDLRQSGIVLGDQSNSILATSACTITPAQILMASPPISECTPTMVPLALNSVTPSFQYEPLSPVETPKIASQDISNTTSSIDLQPFIKALALLGSMHKQNNSVNNSNASSISATVTSNPSNSTSTSSESVKSDSSNLKRERSDKDSVEDIMALKRQRNTDAARRSRQRKAMKMETLEKRVMDLESDNEQLRLRAAIVESERANIEAKEKRSKVRILELEKQLSDTHKALLLFKDTAMKTIKV